MKTFFTAILILLFFISCDNDNAEEIVQIKKENPLGLCDNEIFLLKSESQEKIVFDFDDCMKSIKEIHKCDQFEFIEKQTSIDLCKGPWNFSTNVSFDANQTLNINLLADKYCEESVRISRWCPQIEEVLINANSQVLMEGEYVSNDENLCYNMKTILYKDYIDTEYYKNNEKTFFIIQWDKGTPVKDRVYVFKSLIQAYLMVANDVSKNTFNNEICSLKENHLDSLKRIFSFNLLYRSSPEPIALPSYSLVKHCEVNKEDLF